MMKRLSLSQKSLIALPLGILIGFLLILAGGAEVNWVKAIMTGCSFVGDIYLRLLRMLSVPLVFACILNSISKLRDLRQLKSLGIRTFAIFFVTSCIACTVGIFWAKLLKPGASFTMEDLAASSYEATGKADLLNSLKEMFPTNIFQSLSNGSMIQIIIFCVFAGVAIIMAGEKAKPVIDVMTSIETVMFKITDLVLSFTPIGVFGLMTYTVAAYGATVVGSVAKFILCDYLSAAIALTITYTILLVFIARINPLKFWPEFKEPLIIAVATLVSSATLPASLKITTEKIGVPKFTADFVLPLGATANMNGSAAFFGIITVFTCQLMGTDLSVTQYVMLVLQSVLLAIGCAAVPGIALVLSATLLPAFGLPIAALGLVTGVYRICNIAHCTVNVAGDWVSATCIAAMDHTLDRDKCVAKL